MKVNPFAKKKAKRRRQSSSRNDGWLSLYAKKAIAGIVLLVFSLIAILSFVGGAGPTGDFILMTLKRLFGWLGYLAPLGTIAMAAYLIWPQRMSMERLRVIGLMLASISLLGLVHTLSANIDDSLDIVADGKGGGYIGFFLSFTLSRALSRVASTLIFLGAFLIGLILTFRVSPADIWEWSTGLFSKEGEEGGETKEDIEVDMEEDIEEEASPHFKINAVAKASGASTSSGALPAPRTVTKRYKPQVIELLHQSSGKTTHNKDLESSNKEMIRSTLENFGINVEMAETNVGPTVTQYTLRPEQGTKLARITALQNDLALALAAHPIRIEAPIPNKDLVGIEIPNKKPSLVRLRELLASKQFKENDSPLAFPLGRDVSGNVAADSLDRLPHLLIAGATGSGKSVNVHTLLISWLYRNSPDMMRLILVDPKRVEMTPYNGIPHLLTPVIVDTEKTINALKWALEEMDVRYRLLEESGSRNLLSFNLNNPNEAKPFIVIVIDELADLMVRHAREIEGPIVRLSQMARAVGIHLVLATQRPSVNVITGLIKANVPARIAFSVASQVDSRTILDQAGAEKLVGNGDMLYLSGDKARPLRIQGGFVTEEEVRQVVDVIRQTGEPNYDNSVVSAHGASSGGVGGDTSEEADDPLYEDAKQLVISSGKASASYLQRRLRVGYARAARLLDMLEDQGIIGEAVGNKPREILAVVDEEEAQGVKMDSEVEVIDDSVDENINEGDDELDEEEGYSEQTW